MATVAEPLVLYGVPYFEYTTVLEGQAWVITFRWVDRTLGWYIDIRKDDLTPVVLGVYLAPYFPVCIDYALQDTGLTGSFVLIDKGGFISDKYKDGPEFLPEFYELTYVYED